MSTPVPHPGPRPGDLTLPIAEARAALAAIEHLLDDVGACVRLHDAAAAEVGQGFEGRSRTNFESWLVEVLARLASRRQQLADDADELRRWLADAERCHAERAASQRAWHDRLRAHEADQRARRRTERVP
jgi:hypothetical protein